MKKRIIVILTATLIIIVSCNDGKEGISNCDCKENFWDPEDKKYGDVLVLENTGKWGGENLVKRKEMMNHFNNMISFEKLTPEDKVIRKKCLEKYYNHQEVIQNCE
jgi:hypothetical protein